MPTIPVRFAAEDAGEWAIDVVDAICGEALEMAPRLSRREGAGARRRDNARSPLLDFLVPPASVARWSLHGTTGHERYVERRELTTLANPPALGRPEATVGVLIPIKKSDAW